MIAAMDRKFAGGIREAPFFDVFDVGSIHANGNFVFRFTCHRTGVAADTLAVVDDETEVCTFWAAHGRETSTGRPRHEGILKSKLSNLCLS